MENLSCFIFLPEQINVINCREMTKFLEISLHFVLNKHALDYQNATTTPKKDKNKLSKEI